MAAARRSTDSTAGWTFLTNHGHVLVCLAEDSELRLRDIAQRVGITERAVFSIVNDLELGGYVTRIPVGRRNRYELNPDRPMRHPVEERHAVGDLLHALVDRVAEPHPT